LGGLVLAGGVWAAPADERGGTAAAGKGSAVENSVVKVFATVRYPDPYKPWTKEAPSEATGSGVVIEGKRILSNAHVVLYASQVQVQSNQAGDKISATVEAVAPGIDLAVLRLEDEAFFEGHPPLARARALPEIREPVTAYGYPEGGTSLSITKGIVSRIEFAGYNLNVAGLRIQVDAAVNPGNSGGPAVVGERMIGLTFSHYGGSDNIGYIIPCEEIELFLDDIADGRYDGKPGLFDELQTLENPALRAFLRLDKGVEGIVVHRPESAGAGYPLKEWDVITRIGETPVDDQGMIKLGPNLRVQFQYLVQKLAKDGTVPLTVVRDSKPLTVAVPTPRRRAQVVPDLAGAYPSYFVFGPMVFSSATTQFIAGFVRGNPGAGAASRLLFNGSPLLTRMGDTPAFEGERLVVVSSPFFPHRLTKGYDSPAGQVVRSVNGVRLKNLPHLVEVLRDSRDPFLTVEFASRNCETVVFPRAEMLKATEEILTENGIRSQGTADLIAVWNGGGK
jgi:S1-C subfamily serine protease